MSPESPWWRGALVIAVVLVVHQALLGGLRIDGVRPDLLLGAGVVVAVIGGPEVGAVVAFAAALAGDLFVDTPFGLSALVACAVAFAAGSIQRSLRANPRWAVPVITAGASAAGVALWAALGTVLGLPGLLHPRLVVVAAVVATVNAVVSVPLTPVARWVVAGAPGAVPRAGPRRFAS